MNSINLSLLAHCHNQTHEYNGEIGVIRNILYVLL